MKPSRAILQRIADASYSSTPPSQLDTFSLVRSTPTLKVYRDGDVFVVGIRGTRPTDLNDIKADAAIAVGLLSQTPRYKTDEATLQQVRLEFPSGIFYGVGHSLGGAILDEFLKRGLVVEGLSYNPAVQPTDFKRPLANTRIYQEGDPLYEVMGKNVEGVEVRKPKSPALLRLIRKIPYVGTLLSAVQSHRLENFVGGQPVVSAPPQPPPPPPNIPPTHTLDGPKRKPTEKEIAALMALGRSMGLEDDVIRQRLGLAPPPLEIPPLELNFDDVDDEDAPDPLVALVQDIGLEFGLNAEQMDELLDLARRGVPTEVLEASAEGMANAMGSGKTRREKVLKKLGLKENGYSLSELSKASGVSKATLQEVYNRGIGAYKTNPLSVRLKGSYRKNVKAPMSKKLSKEQWAMARVYSFLDGNPSHDTDLRGGGTMDAFEKQLGEVGYNPSEYLKEARRRAKSYGYDPKSLSFARNGVHKLLIVDEDGKSHRFGRVGYGDHLIWSFRERKGKVPKGTAASKRSRFVKSHSAMKGDWRTNPYSPNNLAIRILW